MRFASKTLTFAPNATMTANLTSDTCDIRTEYGYSFQAVWTGTPTGTLKVQVSNDGANWDDYPSSAQTLSGAAGHYTWDITQTSVAYVHLVYVFSSGTGTLTATFNTKGA